MNRKDGLTPVFKMFLGEIVFSVKRDTDDFVLVKSITYESNDHDFNEPITDYRGNIAYSSMIVKLCDYVPRSEFILKVLETELKEKSDQQIMILAHNKNLITYLFKSIEHRDIASVGYYIGGMKEAALKESEQKKVIIGPKKRGFHIITKQITSNIPKIAKVRFGLLNLFIKHTSALSLIHI